MPVQPLQFPCALAPEPETKNPHPHNQPNVQTTRAEPNSHSKGDAFRKHSLVSTFSMRVTFWNSLAPLSVHHHHSFGDHCGELCISRWISSTQPPSTTVSTMKGLGNFGCSSPGCCSTARPTRPEFQNHSCSNVSPNFSTALGETFSQPAQHQANAHSHHHQPPASQPQTKEPAEPPNSPASANFPGLDKHS